MSQIKILQNQVKFEHFQVQKAQNSLEKEKRISRKRDGDHRQVDEQLETV